MSEANATTQVEYRQIDGFKGENLTGKLFGQLAVVRLSHSDARGKPWWVCKCRCGTERAFRADNLKSGRAASCGCVGLAIATQRFTVHGASTDLRSSVGYGCWEAMWMRCTNPKNSHYASYGGRGITICERWRDFRNFLADMGPRPSRMHTIDRYPDNNGNYEPGNCRWATHRQQHRNMRTNRFVTFRGRSLCLMDWSKEVGISHGVLSYRIRAGWDVERAFSEPVRTYRER